MVHSTTLALIEADNKSLEAAFASNDLDKVLDKIATQVRAAQPDVTTKKGRDEIRSLAYKVAQSKTALDDLGKDMVSDAKEKVKVVDGQRKKARDFLDALKAEVRQPLTDYEQRESRRVAALEERLQELRGKTEVGTAATSQQLTDAIRDLEAVEIDESWQEFAGKALAVRDEGMRVLKERLEQAKQREAEQAELERLRREEAERKAREEEERRRAEEAARLKAAAEQARQEEAARAKAEAERIERERQEQAARAKAEAERVEREKQEAIEAQKRAEQQAKEAEERRQREAAEAEERAKRQAEEAEKARLAAIEQAKRDEQDRIRKQQEADAAEQAKREANTRHRQRINKEAAGDLERLGGIPTEHARQAVVLISEGKIANVTIAY